MHSASIQSTPTPNSNARDPWILSTLDAMKFARKVTSWYPDQQAICQNLTRFPARIQSRGMYFQGLASLVQRHRPECLDTLRREARLPEKPGTMRQYHHRDFYQCYYLTAALLHPNERLSVGVRLVSQTFFPIFRESLVGRTMSALMGGTPRTVLPITAEAYDYSAIGNRHKVEMAGPQRAIWRCEVEPVLWYSETFAGIIEGTLGERCGLKPTITVDSEEIKGDVGRHTFIITW